MRTLQELLEKELRNVPRQILEKRLAEKFKAAGLRATKARTRRLAEYILAGNTGNIAIAKDGRDASIVVTAEGIAGDASLVALLLYRGRSSFANSAPRIEASLSGPGKRDSIVSILAQMDRLPPSVEPVIQEKRDRATGCDANIHAVPIRDFIDFLAWFQSLKCNVRQHSYRLQKSTVSAFSEARNREFTVNSNL